MALKHNAEMLSYVPKHKKALMCFTEKIPVRLNSLVMSYSAFDHDFHVNELAYHLFCVSV
jgi:hypothetical protein